MWQDVARFQGDTLCVATNFSALEASSAKLREEMLGSHMTESRKVMASESLTNRFYTYILNDTALYIDSFMLLYKLNTVPICFS